MNDANNVLLGHTKKYNIPLSHLEYEYIEQCKDEIELEQIHKELVSGEVGSHRILEQLTLDRIRNIQSLNSTLANQKSQETNEESISNLTVANDHPMNVIHSVSNSSNEYDSNFIVSQPIIDNDSKQTIPDYDEEWKKFERKVSADFDDHFEDSDSDEQSDSESYQNRKRLHTAEQQRLNGDTAFKAKNYQQAVDSYTKSITINNSSLTYMNRAKAYFKLNDHDACIQDCSQVLTTNPTFTQALFRRASCYFVKNQYDKAKLDLDSVLTIDPDNDEAQNLLNNVLTVREQNSNPNTGGDSNDMENQSSTATAFLPVPSSIIVDGEQQQVTTSMTHSMNIEMTDRHNSPSPTYDHLATNEYPITSSHYDDDDMALGDEAGGGLVEDPSDEEGRASRSITVSPTVDDDPDIQESIYPKPLDTPPMNAFSYQHRENHNINFGTHRNKYSTVHYHKTNDDFYDSYHTPVNDSISNVRNNSSYKYNTNSFNSRNDTYMQSTTINDAILNSNFGLTIQSWLQDFVKTQPSYRSSSMYDRIWSRSPTPWSLNKIQGDIEKYHASRNYKNAIEISKKLLHNGALDYHFHAESIVNALTGCAQCYLKSNEYVRAIQYTTEALQYNKNDDDALFCRAQAFENENLLLFSYADYVRVPYNSFNSHVAQRSCEKLEIEFNANGDETWREKLPSNQNDDEQYLTYLKLKTEYSETNAYEWYRTYADQYYDDGCFILAIKFYTKCIELQPDKTDVYLKRAGCYLNVFEPQKTIDDCDMVLKDDKDNFDALYRKAFAHKMSREYRSYESTLRECIRIQPTNQIVLTEYYNSQHEKIPRKKRRIRMNLIPSTSINSNSISYEELEQIRLATMFSNLSLNSNDIKDQCSFILHAPEKIFLESHDFSATNLIETIINLCRTMLRAEVHYQEAHKSIILPFSYTTFCFDILVELAKVPQVNVALCMIDEKYRTILDDLLSYYESLSTIYNDLEQLNSLKKL
ncbi:unnamed protein product [Rotaria magnacalcarata]|uniref:Uncharacterized protein n=1 Tax=Rotaria magnacalcarata TaxID=392030 RepID=A0A816RMF7_9BILA|nr:unnamed protein product [Rotaria magnacalcarata]CAF3842545.1 unnamed protein product [Rotaria magnacalcarata]